MRGIGAVGGTPPPARPTGAFSRLIQINDDGRAAWQASACQSGGPPLILLPVKWGQDRGIPTQPPGWHCLYFLAPRLEASPTTGGAFSYKPQDDEIGQKSCRIVTPDVTPNQF